MKQKIVIGLVLTLVSTLSASDSNFKHLESLYGKYFDKELPTVSQTKELVPTLFMFTSSSVPKLTVKNFFSRANKLGTTNYVVYRGLDNNVKRTLIYADKKERGVFAKIHPLMFRDLNIKQVPVTIYAVCPNREQFAYKSCKYLYRMDGDASLNEFFNRASDEDESLKNYRDILNGDI